MEGNGRSDAAGISRGAKSSPAAPIRFQALDSIRGICACMIVLYHFETAGLIYQSSFVRNSFLFVDFFFVLSGFVIASSYGSKLANGFPIAKFMGLRLGRVYPLHIVTLALFLLFELLRGSGLMVSDTAIFGGANNLSMFIASIFLIQPFVGPDKLSWNGPSWSIAVEIWTYLLFALVFRWGRSALVPIAATLALVCSIYLSTLTDRYMQVFHDGAYARCIYGFSLGVLCHRLSSSSKVPSVGFWTASAVEIAVTALVVALVTTVGAGPLSVGIPLIFFLAVFVFSSERGALSSLLSRRLFVWLGTLSYSIYMLHLFVEFRILNALSILAPTTVVHAETNHVGSSAFFGDFMSIVALIVTIFCATLSYRFIEKPGRNWSRRKIFGAPTPKTILTAEANAPAL